MSFEVDLELGQCPSTASHQHGSPSSSSSSSPSTPEGAGRAHLGEPRQGAARQIEDFRAGYPQFSAFVASHHSFHICRKFGSLRSRLLLLKQDQLSVLEKELERLDREEKDKIALGSCRRDRNEARKTVLAEIDSTLADYDSFVERCQHVLRYDTAPSRDVTNLKNWVEGTACIARAETAYIEEGDDLLSILASDDSLVAYLEVMAGQLYIQLRKILHKTGGIMSSPVSLSRNPNVHIFSPSSTQKMVRGLLAPLVTMLLLTPVIICNCMDDMTGRLFVVVLATTFFVAVLSGLTRVCTMQLIVAGATYTTVLVVFISGTENKTPK